MLDTVGGQQVFPVSIIQLGCYNSIRGWDYSGKGQAGGGLQCAYITVLPEARDAEGLQEITATQEQDAQLYR